MQQSLALHLYTPTPAAGSSRRSRQCPCRPSTCTSSSRSSHGAAHVVARQLAAAVDQILGLGQTVVGVVVVFAVRYVRAALLDHRPRRIEDLVVTLCEQPLRLALHLRHQLLDHLYLLCLHLPTGGPRAYTRITPHELPQHCQEVSIQPVSGDTQPISKRQRGE